MQGSKKYFSFSTRPYPPKIFVIVHLFHPLHGFAVKLFGNRDVHHGRGWRGAVPMFLTRRAPYNVPWPNLLDRTSPALYETTTSCDDENLTARMRMPCCPSARFESHTRSESPCGIGRLEQRVNAYRACEILRRSFRRTLR